MAIKNLIEEIESDVKDVVDTKFAHYVTNIVPSVEDSSLTFERGIEKKGKMLESCVLYVDIRDSVTLTEKHHNQTMGRIYTAMTKAVLKIARHHDGYVRNIIGDRVMVVFTKKDCFTNAVDCAISINHVSKYVINNQFKEVDFKCGIGIDYGKLQVIKVGLPRQGTERSENMGLVWVGYPANIASRLTDVANKTIEEEYFEVTRNPINPRAIRPLIQIPPIFGPQSTYDPMAAFYLTTTETIRQTPEEFADSIAQYKNGELFTSRGKLLKFEKKVLKHTYSPILMTQQVFNGYKKANPNGLDIKRNLWKQQNHNIKNVKSTIYGGGVIWTLK
jgi:adenylate cyclase